VTDEEIKQAVQAYAWHNDVPLDSIDPMAPINTPQGLKGWAMAFPSMRERRIKADQHKIDAGELDALVARASSTVPTYAMAEYEAAYRAGEHERAFAAAQAAAQTDANAMCMLGTMFESGSGVDCDDAMAVRFFFSDRNLHSRMPLDPTHVRLKRTCVRPMAFLLEVHSLTS
jgi:hypothetical protein